VTVSLSTRVSPELRQVLVAEARARRVPLGELARDLLAAGVNGGTPAAGDSDAQNEVRCVFADLPPEAGVHRAVALSLARTVDAGGSGAVSAGKEVIELCDWARTRWQPEDWDDDGEDQAEVEVEVEGAADAVSPAHCEFKTATRRMLAERNLELPGATAEEADDD